MEITANTGCLGADLGLRGKQSSAAESATVQKNVQQGAGPRALEQRPSGPTPLFFLITMVGIFAILGSLEGGTRLELSNAFSDPGPNFPSFRQGSLISNQHSYLIATVAFLWRE